MICSQSPSYPQPDHVPAAFLQPVPGGGVALRRMLAVVGGAVDEDRDRAAGPTVDEVRLGVGTVDRLLCGVRDPVALVLQPFDELFFEGAIGLGDQPDGVFGP